MSLHEGDCDLSCYLQVSTISLTTFYLQVSAISLTTFLQLAMEAVDRGDIRSVFICGIMAQWAGRTYAVLRMLDLVTASR